ncbi:MAG: ribonuclease HII [Chloroflexi bacterium]|nr:MAG: ribonuclease HII [Chloroflexota bacterium]
MQKVVLSSLTREIALRKQGYRFIAGIDEAGRGAWAGPVVAAAVILPLDREDVLDCLTGLRDSKKLSPHQRDHFFEAVHRVAVTVSVGIASAEVVDELNVVGATRQAMHQAVAMLHPSPDYLLLDYISLPDLRMPQESYPRAESLSLSVAAASVVAKVTRDRLMVEFSRRYPGYAFDRHKGYGTAAHRAALEQFGPSPIHRLSYRPVLACTGQPSRPLSR